MHWRADLNINTKKTSLAQAILSYFTSPSFKAVTRYRIYRWLYQRGPIGKLLHKPFFVQNCKMGAYVSPLAEIGTGFYLPHPVGVVIGEGARLGNDVTIFQGVTLGVAKEGATEYPELKDGVTVYANAILVGGITVGAHARVAALSFVNRDVPAGAIVAGIPAKVMVPKTPIAVSTRVQ